MNNSLGYERHTFDNIYDDPRKIEEMLQPLLEKDEAAIVNLEDMESVDFFVNDYNDQEFDGGWWAVTIRDYEDDVEPKEWTFDEQTFIEHYCPMECGNDYLGWIDDIRKLLDGEAEPGDATSTGEYAGLTETELRKELKRLTAIVLHQAVDRYVEQNY